jgi:hypothetical protein
MGTSQRVLVEGYRAPPDFASLGIPGLLVPSLTLEQPAVSALLSW